MVLTQKQKEFINRANKKRIDVVIFENLSKKGRKTFNIERNLGKINTSNYSKKDKEVIEIILSNKNIKKHIKYEFINDRDI